MIDKDDLRAAINSGLLSEKQASDLATLALARQSSASDLAPGDEPFELFRGFNEVFIIIGLFILGIGWYSVATLALGDQIVDLKRYAIGVTLAGAIVIWLLSEYFVRRRRMIGPASTLAIMFVVNATSGFFAYFAEPFMIGQGNLESVPLPLFLGLVALLIYWWRFRVPFAMAILAIGFFAVTMVFTASKGGEINEFRDLFLLSAGGPFAWITLILGIIVFAIAMLFDMSDPHRVTRRSTNGFWLHVVAAPALINTIGLTLLNQDTTLSTLGLFVVLAVFAVIAIIIDRRSFLITAIGYVVTVAITVLDGDGVALTVLVLGATMLFLGAFWEKIRARTLRVLPARFPLHRLPPSHV
ncbi:hypothetical protein [Loktanella sp. S4079]|uniref:hypothetical protein n=1 Tax=Loktanella sp. S4079 TaxID=579483 RepID=UPI0005F9EA67|nr:hypothetical protein [Loktanella sp. S4079]KJZ19426.1 membrane protein [Loktanella sp. S4079]